MARCKACNKGGKTFFIPDNLEEYYAISDVPIMDLNPGYRSNDGYLKKDKRTGDYYCRECLNIAEVTARTPNIPGQRYPCYRISYEQHIAEFPEYAQYPKHPEFGKGDVYELIEIEKVKAIVSEDALDHAIPLDELLAAEEAVADEDGPSKYGDYRPQKVTLPETEGGGFWKRARFEE